MNDRMVSNITATRTPWGSRYGYAHRYKLPVVHNVFNFGYVLTFYQSSNRTLIILQAVLSL